MCCVGPVPGVVPLGGHAPAPLLLPPGPPAVRGGGELTGVDGFEL